MLLREKEQGWERVVEAEELVQLEQVVERAVKVEWA